MNRMTQNLFNAAYLTIFLHGARRIMRKIRPISFEDAYTYLGNLKKKPGVKLYAVQAGGIAFHIANAPSSIAKCVCGNLADLFRVCRGNGWQKICDEDNLEHRDRIVANSDITKLIPAEFQKFFPKMAQTLKKVYGDPL